MWGAPVTRDRAGSARGRLRPRRSRGGGRCRDRHTDPPRRRADRCRAIAGWTVTNDVSIRDWQWNTSQTWLGKSFDTHGPIGPWIVTADAFDPQSAVIRTWVNDEQRQEGRLADQILSPAKLVALISQVCTLEPGDLIATGTPGGIGGITGNYLVAGDQVRVEVTGIGQIDNPVTAEPVPVQPAEAYWASTARRTGSTTRYFRIGPR
jgi:2-keto-4-pentenoate hydratase/2-oxohepta-3-ene-1,7-dioic acid hydratase in catechol pathway